ncbi:MAG: YkvA family protein [Thermodesulfobacteriota bacterium]
MKKQSLASRIKHEVNVYRRVITHPRCPRLARICLGAAVAYALSPVDIIPDFIPVLGYLDDIIILPALVFIALRSLPEGLVDEVRAEMMKESNAE